jgi:hypothetical protein
MVTSKCRSSSLKDVLCGRSITAASKCGVSDCHKLWTNTHHVHDLSSSEKNSLAESQLADVFKTQVLSLWYLFVQHERPWVRTKPGRGISTTKYFQLVSQPVNLATADTPAPSFLISDEN